MRISGRLANACRKFAPPHREKALQVPSSVLSKPAKMMTPGFADPSNPVQSRIRGRSPKAGAVVRVGRLRTSSRVGSPMTKARMRSTRWAALVNEGARRAVSRLNIETSVKAWKGPCTTRLRSPSLLTWTISLYPPLWVKVVCEDTTFRRLSYEIAFSEYAMGLGYKNIRSRTPISQLMTCCSRCDLRSIEFHPPL